MLQESGHDRKPNHPQDKVITQALRFELGKPANLDEWARARKRLYDTNVFRQVDIEAVPMGEVQSNGVQPVKAQVSVVEYPAWSLRYGTQLEGERQARHRRVHQHAQNLGLVAEVKNPNLFGRALTLGLFGRSEREQQGRDCVPWQRHGCSAGARARPCMGSRQRDRIRDEEGIEDHSPTLSPDGRERGSTLALLAASRSSTATGSSATAHSTPDPSAGDPFPLDFVVNLARLSGAVLFDRRDDPLSTHKGTFTSASWDHSDLWLGSDVRNRKLLTQQLTFLPIGEKLVFASRVQAGFVFGPDILCCRTTRSAPAARQAGARLWRRQPGSP